MRTFKKITIQVRYSKYVDGMIYFLTFIPSSSSILLKLKFCEPMILLFGMGQCPPEYVRHEGSSLHQTLCVHLNACHNSLLGFFSKRLMKPSTTTNQEGGAGMGDQKINVDDLSPQCEFLTELKQLPEDSFPLFSCHSSALMPKFEKAGIVLFSLFVCFLAAISTIFRGQIPYALSEAVIEFMLKSNKHIFLITDLLCK